MAIDTESNNGVYFVLGALVVAVAALGFIYMSADTDMGGIEPSSGYERPATNQNTVDNTPDTTTKFDMRVDDDGVSSTTTQSND